MIRNILSVTPRAWSIKVRLCHLLEEMFQGRVSHSRNQSPGQGVWEAIHPPHLGISVNRCDKWKPTCYWGTRETTHAILRTPRQNGLLPWLHVTSWKTLSDTAGWKVSQEKVGWTLHYKAQMRVPKKSQQIPHLPSLWQARSECQKHNTGANRAEGKGPPHSGCQKWKAFFPALLWGWWGVRLPRQSGSPRHPPTWDSAFRVMTSSSWSSSLQA